MLAAGKASQSLVVSHLQSNARVGSSLMIGSVRTLFVPSGSRKKMYKHFSATAAVGKRIRGEPSLDVCRAMPLSPQGTYDAVENETRCLYEDIFSSTFHLTLIQSLLYYSYFYSKLPIPCRIGQFVVGDARRNGKSRSPQGNLDTPRCIDR
jgi:hypothetical protein